jgi:hypothetical protein
VTAPEEKSNLGKSLTIVTATAGAAAVTGLVAGQPLVAAGAAGLAIIPGLVERMVDYIGGRRERTAKAFFSRVVTDASEKTLEEITGLLDVGCEDVSAAAETIFAGYRKMRDNPHECVATALGALTAIYLAQERDPDSFFRGFGDVLANVTRAEFEDLRKLMAAAARQVRPDQGNVYMVGIVNSNDVFFTGGIPETGERAGPFVHFRTVYNSLIVSGLLTDPGGLAHGHRVAGETYNISEYFMASEVVLMTRILA